MNISEQGPLSLSEIPMMSNKRKKNAPIAARNAKRTLLPDSE
jgi:hypothetical protein